MSASSIERAIFGPCFVCMHASNHIGASQVYKTLMRAVKGVLKVKGLCPGDAETAVRCKHASTSGSHGLAGPEASSAQTTLTGD